MASADERTCHSRSGPSAPTLGIMPAIPPARRGPGGVLRADTARAAGARPGRLMRLAAMLTALAILAGCSAGGGPGASRTGNARVNPSEESARPSSSSSGDTAGMPASTDGTLSSTELGLVYQFILQRYVDKVDHADAGRERHRGDQRDRREVERAAARSRPDRPGAPGRPASPSATGRRSRAATMRWSASTPTGPRKHVRTGPSCARCSRPSRTTTRCSWSRRRCGG